MLNFSNPVGRQLVFVTKDVNNDSDNDLINEASDLSEGEIALVDPDNVGATDGGTNDIDGKDYIRIVQRRGNELWYSNKITTDATVTFLAGTADVQQVTYLGYNGTSGSMDDTAEQNYIVNIVETGFPDAERMMSHMGQYESLATTTQYAIAKNLVDNLVLNVNGSSPAAIAKRIRFDVICDEAGSDTSGGTISATKGSTTITIAESSGAAGDAAKYNSDAATIVAGDFIRFSVATEALTDPVYRVVSISGTTALKTIVLDRAFNGTTNTAIAANTVSVIASATGIAAEFGIKMTGVDDDDDYKVGINYPYIRTFRVDLKEGFTDAVVTYNTAGVIGKGNWKTVKEHEKFAQGGMLNFDEYNFPAKPFDNLIANSTDGPYDTICIKQPLTHQSSMSTTTMYEYIYVYLSNDSANGYSNEEFINNLADFMGDSDYTNYS